jgi:hypothetical protein
MLLKKEDICMRKKIIIFLVSVTCAISLSACADNSQVQSDTSQSENTQNESSQANADTDSEVPATETDAVENDQLWKSPLGYSMTYDPSLFTQESVDSTDYFTCLQDNLDTPVYISIQAYPDTDSTTLADGLVLQSGDDGVTAEDIYFGADSIEAQNVYIEKEVDGITQVQIFYVIPVGEGSLLVEAGSYVGVPETIDSAIENMFGTFKTLS